VNWRAGFPAGTPIADLPTYAFQRRRYWLQTAWTAAADTSQPGAAQSDTTRTAVAGGEDVFWAAVDAADPAALAGTLDLPADTDLSPLLPALAAWRRREQRRSRIDSWRYRIAWKPITPAVPAVLRGTWLVVAPENGDPDLLHAYRQALAVYGADVLAVTADSARCGRDGLAGLLRAAVPEGTAVAGVLSLLAFDETPHPEYPALAAGLAGTVTLVQALLDSGVGGPLWCVTSGAVSAARSEYVASPVQTQVWGLGRIVALDEPGLWGGLIDLPADPDERALRRLAAVLADGSGQDQLAVRPSGVFACRLVPAPLGAAPATRPWQPHGSVLITGGTGALGAHAARWLAAHGAEHLVLTSRRGRQAPGAADLEAELTALGARVRIVACDLADRDSVAALLAGIPEQYPLTAVLHAAGVGHAASVRELRTADLAATIAGKVAGAAHLDELLGDRPLDAFVLYSSNAAVWGSGGQAAYAAANAFLDGLAERRRARGRTATSIAWGGWGGGEGMMAVAEIREMLGRRGVLEMEPELAMAALVEAVEHGDRSLSVAAVDWARFVPGFTARRPAPLLADLPAIRQAEQPAQAAPEPDSGLVRRLAGAGPRDRERILLDLVRASVASALGHDSPDAIDPVRLLRDIGFDSIVSVDLRNRLAAATGLRLPASLAFDHPTVAAIARYLDGELSGGAGAPAAEPAAPAAGGASRAADAARGHGDPVAIVGMACRLPGGVTGPDDLWQVLVAGRDVVAEAPADRGWEGLDLARILAAPDQLTFLHEGGFLADAGLFDAEFFGISAEEATAMDPQQRLLLEMSWEALERGAVDAGTLRGSDTGVFLGTFFQGYTYTNRQAPKATRPYLAGGSAPAIAAGRIAFALGLQGPTFTVDTGCSSSAVAIHLATRALRAGDCSLALAGGVTVMSHPVSFPALGGGAAADGRCKSFSADADGTGWGEGAGMLLLERLSDAVRHGHPVLAVIRGTAVNHDGATDGLTAPNGPSQERVIRAALADAGVGPADVDVVEAHGTGSPLGDSVEAEAMLSAYGRDRGAAGRPLLLGTVKANIGHPQAASGVVGVIKTVLSLRNAVLPRMPHSARPTPLVDWSSGGVELLTEDTPWPRNGRPRRAGVSSFGGSGTKVHLILEEPGDRAALTAATDTAATDTAAAATAAAATTTAAGITRVGSPTPTITPWVVSGRSPEALRAQAVRLAAHLRDGARPPAAAVDVAYTLAATRAVFDHRAVVVAEGDQALLTGLEQLGRGEPGPDVVTGEAAGDRRVALVFPDGSGSSGSDLYARYPVYADAWDAVCAHFDGYLDLSLRDAVFADGPRDAALSAAAAFATQVALARLLQAWGVEPGAVAGLGTGAVAAVHVAGGLDLADAVALLLARGAAIAGGADAGGDPADRLGRAMRELRFAGPHLPILSGDGGEFLTAERLVDPRLWLPARPGFPAADLDADRVADKLRAEGIGIILTVDPAVLGDPAGLQKALASAFVRGAAVDWAAQFAGTGAARVELPTYAFQRERYWLATGSTGSTGAAAAAESGNRPAAVDDKARKELVLEYFRRVNEGDVDRVLDLFAADAVIEDPVGQDPRQGAEALREYYEITLEQAATEVVVGKPTGAQDGSSVAIPVTGHLVALRDPERRRVSIDCVDVFQIDGDGRIKELRVYWGLTDYAF
jgi:acyl transferase domain-containing protein/acyl carrier protein